MQQTYLSFIAAMTAFLFGGAAVAQGNTGNTPAGASTSPGAGIVTSGTAAPQAQTPRATDTTLGKQPGGTGAGMGSTAAGTSPKAAGEKKTVAKKKATKKKTAKKKTADEKKA